MPQFYHFQRILNFHIVSMALEISALQHAPLGVVRCVSVLRTQGCKYAKHQMQLCK